VASHRPEIAAHLTANIDDRKQKLADCKKTFTELESTRKDMSKLVDQINKSITSKKDKLKKFRQERKTDNDSLYSMIDSILAENNIKRAEYHGGDLTGVHGQILMHGADSIMTAISDCLKQNKSERCTLSDDEISSKCSKYAKLLSQWNGVLSLAHTVEPIEEDFELGDKLVKKTMALTRDMGISVTIKGHGTESHLIPIMRRVPGGLNEFDESWGEQIHQSGRSNDLKYRNMSELQKAKYLKKQEIREQLPKTQFELAKLDVHKRGPSKKTIDKNEEKAKLKKDNLDKLVE